MLWGLPGNLRGDNGDSSRKFCVSFWAFFWPRFIQATAIKTNVVAKDIPDISVMVAPQANAMMVRQVIGGGLKVP